MSAGSQNNPFHEGFHAKIVEERKGRKVANLRIGFKPDPPLVSVTPEEMRPYVKTQELEKATKEKK